MSLPDLATNPDAVLSDKVSWRFGRAPDYKKTRDFYEKTKTKSHAPGSLESIVENLVKNWEIEASYKTNLKEWRTIDPEKYTFSVNGGPNIPGEKMIQVGTYNALLSDSNFYSPEHNDFTVSHKVFKRMMPVFAWEVLEVYSGPPTVAFRWRHWGEMKNDYVGTNRNGQQVRVKAHGGMLDIEGMLVARVNDKLQINHIDCWMDPLALFDEVTKNGAEVIVENTPESVAAVSKCPFAAARANM